MLIGLNSLTCVGAEVFGMSTMFEWAILSSRCAVRKNWVTSVTTKGLKRAQFSWISEAFSPSGPGDFVGPSAKTAILISYSVGISSRPIAAF